MSVAGQVKRIKTNIKASYTALEEKGATMPTDKNSDNLASTIANLEIGSSASDEMLKSIVEGSATDVVLPDSITSIANALFQVSSSDLPTATINSIIADEVTQVGKNAFSSQNLLKIINLPKCEVINDNSFTMSTPNQIEKVILGSLSKVGYYGLGRTFANSQIEYSFSFNNCEISGYAFSENSFVELDLTGVKSVLGRNAFSNNGTLKKIWLPSTIETISPNSSTQRIFYGAPSTCVIYTDVASAEAIPSSWGSYWGVASGTVVYGATYEDFLNA